MEETTLQKIAKNIFRHPFFTALVIAALLSIIAWTWLLNPTSGYQADAYFVVNMALVLAFWLIFGGCGILLQDSFITYNPDHGYGYYDCKKILLKLNVKNGKVVATGDCFWGRAGIHEISIERCSFIVNTLIACKVGPYCKVTVPVTLEIFVDGDKPSDYQELYEKVIVGAGVNSVEKFVQKLIEKSIAENQQTFADFAFSYSDRVISSTALLHRMIALLNFPDNALSNFDSFKICLADPTMSTCKGSEGSSSCSS